MMLKRYLTIVTIIFMSNFYASSMKREQKQRITVFKLLKMFVGHLLIVCRRVAKTKGLHPTGFRVIMNEGPQGGPTVDHLHLHVMGHRQMMWPFC